MFLEINDKIELVRKNLEKIEKHDAIIKDVLKDLEKVKFELSERYATKKDVEKLVDSIKDVVVEEMTGISPVAFENLRRRVAILENEKKSIEELETEKRNLIMLMDKVDRDFQMKRISKRAYEELKRSIEIKLEEIEMVLEEKKKKVKKGRKPLEIPKSKKMMKEALLKKTL